MTAVRRLATPWLIAAAAYAALTVAFMWPVVAHLSSAWPHDPNDPALSAAILSWDAHALPMTHAWWDAPIFWPVQGALSFSEHLLGISLLTTPLLWSGADALTAYNVAFLCAFPLTALAAHALAFAWLKRHDVACLAGCIFGFSPYRVSQLAHIQMLWAFGMPLALMALHKFTEQRHRRWLVVFGLAWLAQAAANGYYMLFFPVLLAAWVLWFAREPKSLVPITATWVLATLPLAPLFRVYARQHAAMGLSRGISEIESFSADMTAVFAASPDLMAWHRLSQWSRPEGQLFPGALALVLIGAAIAVAVAKPRVLTARDAAGWRIANATAVVLAVGFLAVAVSVPVFGPWKWSIGTSTIATASSMDKPLSASAALFVLAAITSWTFRFAWHRRSVFGFYLCAAAAMLVLSFGPRPTLGGAPFLFRAPYAWLMALPGFSEVRVPARFGMLFVLCVAMAAATGFARLTVKLSPLSRRALAAIAVALILVESWPRVTMAPPAAPIAALQGISDRAPVLELPLGITERDIAAEYRSLEHGHPTVNGYSGYEARHYEVLKIGLRLNDGAVIDELARDRDLIVAVDHREQFERWTSVVGPRPVIADDGTWRLYRVAAGTGPPPADGAPLRIQSVTANFRNEAVGRMLDGDLRTAWTTGRVQAGGESLVIDLGRAQDLSAVRLAVGPFTIDFPRGLSAECSADRQQWATCWRGSATALAMRAMLDNPLTGSMLIPVSARAVRYVRLRQTSTDPINGWAVAELGVFGR
jgi:F5/8 type C domain